MITNQFRIYLCHFHCSHWQNHLLNFTFREKGPLVLVKTTFSSLFWNKLLIPHANCNGHVPFDMFHHIRPQTDTLGFFGRKYLSEQHWQMRNIRLHGCIHVIVWVAYSFLNSLFEPPHDETYTQALFMRTVKILIRLGGCQGWSESSLGAHAIL